MNTWNIYGSSRIGVYQTNINLVEIKFNADTSEGEFIDINSITTTLAERDYSFHYLYRGLKHYELTNHLGNVLSVISDKKIIHCANQVLLSEGFENGYGGLYPIEGSFNLSGNKLNVVAAGTLGKAGGVLPLEGKAQHTYKVDFDLTLSGLTNVAVELYSNYNNVGGGYRQDIHNFTSNGHYRFSFNGKESDSETYGDGNAMDFGARIYDSRLGRWLSVDPSQRKYPHLSPYNSFENNPIYFNDPDGKDAGYTISGNTITFSAQIYISGSGATIAKAKEIQSQINQNWGNDYKYTDAKGKTYNVKFDIQVAVIDATNKEQQANFQKGSANIVSLVSNPKKGFRDYVLDGNTGVWKENGATNVRGHETGHMFGLEDMLVIAVYLTIKYRSKLTT